MVHYPTVGNQKRNSYWEWGTIIINTNTCIIGFETGQKVESEKKETLTLYSGRAIDKNIFGRDLEHRNILN